MILTHQLIEACRTDRGGFTKATVNALGLSWKQTEHRGWLQRLEGTEISDDNYQLALDGREKLKRKPKRVREDAPEGVQKRKRNRALLEEILQRQKDIQLSLAILMGYPATAQTFEDAIALDDHRDETLFGPNGR